MNQNSFAEIAEILKELGIEGPTDEIVKEMDDNYASLPEQEKGVSPLTGRAVLTLWKQKIIMIGLIFKWQSN